ncbi:peptide chain release factor N(5)-glutamine methyltransferase [Clostridium guangxiense]|uniref:peptide chain release factor N(5)-glutamine methyltransferase n=1 Tax=Clostridium guangxiense TaxID=1662055 RepID=UPI001E5510F0|nr:peptide chain release factor N(5)-glutamine methyltransferase [Clostridium guangxiense]MCD2346979.1 peptide chain release factor N(5)-glutamine methyltransferase [Clostridium guangxiense]
MTIKDILFKAYNELKKVDGEFYISDSQILLQHVLKKDRLFILTNMDYEVDDTKCKEYFSYIRLRKNKMPVKYITKQCEFMGLDFFVKEGVLIPRPDTEILVEEVMKNVEDKKYTTVCDVCTGSGAIGLSIAHYEKNVNVFCIDISDEAIEVSNKNCEKFGLHNVKIEKGNLLKKQVDENIKFDVIVSNPPYIPLDEINNLMEDVRNFEPHIALSGGQDGLEFYRKITKQSVETLNSGGLLAYEIGSDQWEDVKRIMQENGFVNVQLTKDLAGNDRVVTGFKK